MKALRTRLILATAMALSALGPMAVSASSGSQAPVARKGMVITATIRGGPDKGLSLVGLLSGKIVASVRVTGRVISPGLTVPLTGQVMRHGVKLVFHLPGGGLLTGVGGTRGIIRDFRHLPSSGLLLGMRRGDVGDWAIGDGSVRGSSITQTSPSSGVLVTISSSQCSVMSATVSSASYISGGTVNVIVVAALGSKCAMPYNPPATASFTVNGVQYTAGSPAVLSSAANPGSFIAEYLGSVPGPAGQSCVTVTASVNGVPAQQVVITSNGTPKVTDKFKVC